MAEAGRTTTTTTTTTAQAGGGGGGTAAAAPVGMQLGLQDYAKVLGALQAAAEPKGHERRTSTRMDVQAQVKVFPYKDGQLVTPYTCLTRDLSFRGVGLFQAIQVPRGAQLVVVLPRQPHESLAVLCVVMYCRALADGLYNVGVSFIKPFDLDGRPASELRPTVAATPPAAPGANEAELNRIRQSILG